MNTSKRPFFAVCVAGAALAVAGGPALAHHSYGSYDMTRTERATATIKEVRWTAPHASIVVLYKGADGQMKQMVVATARPSDYVKAGFKLQDFRVADKVDLTWHPQRNGLLGGHVSTIRIRDGRTFLDPEVKAINGPVAKPAAPVQP